MFGYCPTADTQAAERMDTATVDSSELNDDDDRPRFENVDDNCREVSEARLLPGFHDIDPLRKEQVSTPDTRPLDMLTS